MVNGVTSTYHNLLTARSGDVEDYIGSFSCTVSNSRGSSPPQTVDIDGTSFVAMYTINDFFLVADIVITGNEERHEIQSSVSISCSSDLSVQTIRWLNNSDNGRELFSNSGQQQLLLPIERVASFLANTMYTCEVQVMLSTGRIEVFQQAIMIQVQSKKDT